MLKYNKPIRDLPHVRVTSLSSRTLARSSIEVRVIPSIATPQEARATACAPAAIAAMAFHGLFKKKKTPEQIVALLAKDLADLATHALDDRALEKARATHWAFARRRRRRFDTARYSAAWRASSERALAPCADSRLCVATRIAAECSRKRTF